MFWVRVKLPPFGPVNVLVRVKLPLALGVSVCCAVSVLPWGPVSVEVLLQPAPPPQLPLRDHEALGPVALRLVVVPLALCVRVLLQLLPEFVVTVWLCVQVPPEQVRLKLRVAPCPLGLVNERVPERMPGERVTVELCDQPGVTSE